MFPDKQNVLCRNAKGILLVNPSIRDVDIQLRPSMVKFEETNPEDDAVFGLVGYSFPYKLGYLNLQVRTAGQPLFQQM